MSSQALPRYRRSRIHTSRISSNLPTIGAVYDRARMMCESCAVTDRAYSNVHAVRTGPYSSKSSGLWSSSIAARFHNSSRLIGPGTARCPTTRERNQHRHRAFVLTILVAVRIDQISFFKLDGQHDVCGRRNREQEMRDRHRWRHPEDKKPAHIQRMPHHPVKSRRCKWQCGIRAVPQIQPHLAKSEQVEVINQKRRYKNEHPAESEQRSQDQLANRIFNRPDDASDRFPLREEQDQGQAREQNVSRTLDRLWNNSRPPLLEPSPCHDAVLESEQQQQRYIDRDGQPRRAWTPHHPGFAARPDFQ